MNESTFIPAGRFCNGPTKSEIALYGGADRDFYIRTKAKTNKVAKKQVQASSKALARVSPETQLMRHVVWIAKRQLPAPKKKWLKANIISSPGEVVYARRKDLVRVGLDPKLLDRASPDQIGKMLIAARDKMRTQTELLRTSTDSVGEARVDRGVHLKTLADGTEVYEGLQHNGEIWSRRVARFEVPASQIGSFVKRMSGKSESSPTLLATKDGRAIFVWDLAAYKAAKVS